MCTSLPSNEIVPPSAGWIPAIVFTSVDLPAPLSPTSATTSPGRTSKSTSLSAWTGPKLLLTPFRASTGVLSLAFITRLLSRGRTGAPRGAPPHSPHVTYWMPASLQPAAYLPEQISSADQNLSLMIVSLMLSLVTATGVSRIDGTCFIPLSISSSAAGGSSPVASATASSAAASASALIAL